MSRETINSSQYHVPIEGFSQVVVAHPSATHLFVSGLTCRAADGAIVGVGEPQVQMRQIFANLTAVLAAADATLDDVVSIRTYVTDMGCWSALEPVWREHWGTTWPASTLVEVARLFDPRQMIELEATAVTSRHHEDRSPQ